MWRRPGEVQVGATARVVLHGLTRAEENLLLDLSGHIAPGSAAVARSRHGVPEERCAELLAAVLPVPTTPPLAGTVALLDDAPLTRHVGRLLADIESITVRTRSDRGRCAPDLVVLTDSWVTDPCRTTPLMRHDVTHLPLVVGWDAVHVGPVVVPGRTACTTCLDLARAEVDDAWPAVATQLRVLAAPPAVAPWRLEVAAGLAVASITRALRRMDAPGWLVGHDGVTPGGQPQLHERCTCHGLPLPSEEVPRLPS